MSVCAVGWLIWAYISLNAGAAAWDIDRNIFATIMMTILWLPWLFLKIIIKIVRWADK